MDPGERLTCHQLLQHPYMDLNMEMVTEGKRDTVNRNKNKSRTSNYPMVSVWQQIRTFFFCRCFESCGPYTVWWDTVLPLPLCLAEIVFIMVCFCISGFWQEYFVCVSVGVGAVSENRVGGGGLRFVFQPLQYFLTQPQHFILSNSY